MKRHEWESINEGNIWTNLLPITLASTSSRVGQQSFLTFSASSRSKILNFFEALSTEIQEILTTIR